MPILNEKVFASKCTISDSAPQAVPSKDRPSQDPPRAKEDTKDKESSANSSNKTSKHNSTDSESSPAPAGNQPSASEESVNVSGGSSIGLNKGALSQAKPGSTYPTSIQHQQSTSSSSSQLQTPPLSSSISSKFSGTPVPNRVFVGGISTDVRPA